MMKKIKQEKGITLLILVIVIIIMAILITVTINSTINDDLIDTALNTTDKYVKATVFQALNTTLVSERGLYENGFITKEQMWKNIKNSIETNSELKERYDEDNITVDYNKDNDGETYLTVKIGEVTYTITIDKVKEQ